MSNRRQHTIPQFYLRPFLSPGWVYRLGSSAPRATKNPVDVAVQRDYYGRNKLAQKTLDDINSWIESKGAPVWSKLIANPSTFTQHDWEVLSYLVANFAVRIPGTIEDIRAVELSMIAQVNEMAGKMRERLQEALLTGSDLSEFPTAIPDDESPTMTLDDMNERAVKLKEEGGHRVAAHDTFGALPYVAGIIQQMRVLVLKAPKGLFFLTSDRPLVLRSQRTGSPVGAGWANPDIQGTIPLDPSRYVFIFHADSPGIEKPLEATPKVMDDLNSSTILFAGQEIYSPFKYLEAEEWMRRTARRKQ